MLKPGTRVGSYVVTALHAAGGMGVVYRGKHALLGQEVAIKVLLPNLALNDRVRARFGQEAYVQAQLVHSSIVQVRDLVVDDDLMAIVLEFIDGPALDRFIVEEQRGPLPWRDALRILEPVFSAVAYAHARRVVHRDLKPANILLDRRGAVARPGIAKVTDFGLARIMEDMQGLTVAGTRMGTIPFMAPEQFGARTADAPSDVFSLGMVLRFALLGRLPLDPDDLVAASRLYTGHEPLQDVRDLAPDVPETVAEAIGIATAIEPRERYPSAAEFERALFASAPRREAHPRAPGTSPEPDRSQKSGPHRRAPSQGTSDTAVADPAVPANPVVTRGSVLLGEPAPPVGRRRTSRDFAPLAAAVALSAAAFFAGRGMERSEAPVPAAPATAQPLDPIGLPAAAAIEAEASAGTRASSILGTAGAGASRTETQKARSPAAKQRSPSKGDADARRSTDPDPDGSSDDPPSTDGSPSAATAVEWASRSPRPMGASPHVESAPEPPVSDVRFVVVRPDRCSSTAEASLAGAGGWFDLTMNDGLHEVPRGTYWFSCAVNGAKSGRRVEVPPDGIVFRADCLRSTCE